MALGADRVSLGVLTDEDWGLLDDVKANWAGDNLMGTLFKNNFCVSLIRGFPSLDSRFPDFGAGHVRLGFLAAGVERWPRRIVAREHSLRHFGKTFSPEMYKKMSSNSKSGFVLENFCIIVQFYLKYIFKCCLQFWVYFIQRDKFSQRQLKVCPI